MKDKTLVAYFSASGVTAGVAEELAGKIGADIYEIKPKVPYTSADLNWMDKKSRSSIEMNQPDSRPEIEGAVEDFEQYQKILIGFPVWWYVEPKIIDTFLESYDFSDKTVIPFATSGGSGIERCVESMKECCPAAKITKGRLLNHQIPAEWLREIESY